MNAVDLDVNALELDICPSLDAKSRCIPHRPCRSQRREGVCNALTQTFNESESGSDTRGSTYATKDYKTIERSYNSSVSAEREIIKKNI
ncbi:hypothetical protein NQ317_019477 [Molorchus minor]|uniref:Uncharacterized protein n=1 Tax=Molorchus minor TaxID=1323400 RepID=A0ABQ9JNT9_9CUCU|nr:hypothetical protein NQ317_019477 [Molorchus minor]